MGRTYSVLHTFDYTNGAYPVASLILSSNTLYGTTSGGGLGGGTIFKINIDGTGFQNLHNFAQTPPLFNEDDIPVAGGLVLSGTLIYGTTSGNSAGDNGTVFAINIDGSGFTNLYAFSATSEAGNNYDGAHPYAALALAGDKLFGTAALGGSSGNGTIFTINVDGSGFTTIHSFSGSQDGARPKGGLVIQSNVLYGTTSSGANGTGTIFRLRTDGTAFNTIYSFSAVPTSGPFSNSDGLDSWATLAISGDTLYGTSESGGGLPVGEGTVFKVGIEGTDFALLHIFSWGNVFGQQPFCGVVSADGVLFGAATYGGTSDNGTIYSLNTDGTAFDSLYSFPSSVDIHGWYPSDPILRTTNNYGALPFGGGVIFSSNVLYGVTASGGQTGYGVVYSLSLERLPLPPLTAYFTNAWFGPGIELSAPITNVVGFPPIRIQASADLSFTTFFYPGKPPDNRTNNGIVIGTYPLSSHGFFRLVQRW